MAAAIALIDFISLYAVIPCSLASGQGQRTKEQEETAVEGEPTLTTVMPRPGQGGATAIPLGRRWGALRG